MFGDLNSEISKKLTELHSIQLEMSDVGFTEEVFMVESRVHHELDVLLRQ